jgi:hypothetical protein
MAGVSRFQTRYLANEPSAVYVHREAQKISNAPLAQQHRIFHITVNSTPGAWRRSEKELQYIYGEQAKIIGMRDNSLLFLLLLYGRKSSQFTSPIISTTSIECNSHQNDFIACYQ